MSSAGVNPKAVKLHAFPEFSKAGTIQYVMSIARDITVLRRAHHEQERRVEERTNEKEIAERLYISPKTVETHKYSITEKLQAKSIPYLTRIAIQKNLIKL